MTGVNRADRATSSKEKKDSLPLPEEASKRDSSRVAQKKRGASFSENARKNRGLVLAQGSKQAGLRPPGAKSHKR